MLAIQPMATKSGEGKMAITTVLVNLLSEVGVKVNFVSGEIISTNGVKSRGVYNKTSHSIRVSQLYENWEEVLVHESIHALQVVYGRRLDKLLPLDENLLTKRKRRMWESYPPKARRRELQAILYQDDPDRVLKAFRSLRY